MSSQCPNCGKGSWSDSTDHECPSCGFKKIKSKLLDEKELIYCSKCGCNYLGENGVGCTQHPPEDQSKVKL